MVYRLNPLEMSFEFENREYDLGDTIGIQINLRPLVM